MRVYTVWVPMLWIDSKASVPQATRRFDDSRVSQYWDQKADLTEEEAKAKLDALAAELKDYKSTLEAAGYRWPGDAAPQPPASTGNPFKEQAGQHLKALQERLAKAKG